MTYAAIALPPPVQQMVDLSIEACWRGRRALVAQYGRPSEMARSNAGAFADLGWALTRVRRLAKILRYAFVTMAAWLEVKVVAQREKPDTDADRMERAPSGAPPSAPPGAPEGARSSLPRFVVSTRYRVRFDDTPLQQQPAHLARTQPNKLRTLARRLEALTHALLDPAPYIRRLARHLHRDVCHIPRGPKRPPRRREFLDYLDDIREHARFELWRLRRKRQDSS